MDDGYDYKKADSYVKKIKELCDGHDEFILRRIVFVDENGDFAYEFRFNIEKLGLMEEGMIIYPETIIKKVEINSDGRCIIELDGNYVYYY